MIQVYKRFGHNFIWTRILILKLCICSANYSIVPIRILIVHPLGGEQLSTNIISTLQRMGLNELPVEVFEIIDYNIRWPPLSPPGLQTHPSNSFVHTTLYLDCLQNNEVRPPPRIHFIRQLKEMHSVNPQNLGMLVY